MVHAALYLLVLTLQVILHFVENGRLNIFALESFLPPVQDKFREARAEVFTFLLELEKGLVQGKLLLGGVAYISHRFHSFLKTPHVGQCSTQLGSLVVFELVVISGDEVEAFAKISQVLLNRLFVARILVVLSLLFHAI